MAIKHRLDDLTHDGFGNKEQRCSSDSHEPARIDGCAERNGNDACQGRANIRHEPQECGENAPQGRARDADEKQTSPDDDAEGCVNPKLREKVPAEPAGRVVHGGSRSMQIS
jgi:hypothetical protein